MQGSDAAEYLCVALKEFHRLKELAEKAIARVSLERFYTSLDEETNCIAVLMKHVAGNMQSRWTDFLDQDGEKPRRCRDREFEIEEGEIQAVIFDYWENGWQRLFQAFDTLQESDLSRIIYIRCEPLSVLQAINRSLSHTSYHVGQIVFVAKYLRAGEWDSLSIERGESEEYNLRFRTALINIAHSATKRTGSG